MPPMKFNVPSAKWLLILLFCAATLTGCLGSPPQFFDSDGQSLAYRIEGQGPPLILVHGFMGTGPIHWQVPGTSARLAKNFQVITLDCRGHGDSDKPVDVADYGLKMVEDVRRLMDHLEIDSAHLTGYSMGGWISLKFAATYPERVRALAVGGSGYRDFTDKQLSQLFNDLIVPLLHPGYDPVAFEACSDAFPEFQLSKDEVAALPSSLLALAGSEDFARSQVERLADARPDAMVVILPGNDHNSTLFAPQFQEELAAFFIKTLKFSTP